MLKDVLINIKGAQGSDGEESVIELTTDGRFGEKNGGFYITYDESGMIGIDNVKTSLYIKPDNSVILQRSGAIDSRIVVESGKRSVCYYNTPAGEMLIGIFGEKVEHNLKKNGGSISMKYTIDQNLNFVSRNTVSITVREVKE